MAYKWVAALTDITLWIDSESTIKIGNTPAENFPTARVESIENRVVDLIIGDLEIGWSNFPKIPGDVKDSWLSTLAAMATAGYIMATRFGTNVVGDVAPYNQWLINQVWEAIDRKLISHKYATITGLNKRPGVKFEELVLLVKARRKSEVREAIAA